MLDKPRDRKPHVGDRVRFAEEKQHYTIQATDGKRFIVCTKPFNLKRTVLYTIVDLKQGVRGTENLIFGMGFETKAHCQRALRRLVSGETEVSHRNRIPVIFENIERVGGGW